MVASLKLNYNNGFRLPTPKPKKEYKEHSQFVYALIYHRNTILVALLFAFFALVMGTGMLSAYCKTWADFGPSGEDVGGLLGMLVDDGGWIDQIVGANKITEYADLLKISASGSSFTIGGVGSLSSLSGIITNVNNLFKTIGWGLALIFWGYGFTEMMMESNGQLIAEQVIKKLLFLVVTYYVIDNSLVLCSEIVSAGTEVTNAALGGLTAPNISGADKFKEDIFNSCWSEASLGPVDLGSIVTTVRAAGWLVTLCIPWLVTLICDILIRITCWSRAIEICIFVAISPIMFIDLGTTRDLTHSSTARAIKNLISLAIQGALILISLSICQAIMSGILTSDTEEFIDKVWKMVLIAMLQVGTISKTQSLAKQALGM